MASVSITVRIGWVREEPSGEKCYICGDGCWLEQWRLRAESVGKRKRVLGKLHLCACKSCREAMKEDDDT